MNPLLPQLPFPRFVPAPTRRAIQANLGSPPVVAPMLPPAPPPRSPPTR